MFPQPHGGYRKIPYRLARFFFLPRSVKGEASVNATKMSSKLKWQDVQITSMFMRLNRSMYALTEAQITFDLNNYNKKKPNPTYLSNLSLPKSRYTRSTDTVLLLTSIAAVHWWTRLRCPKRRIIS